MFLDLIVYRLVIYYDYWRVKFINNLLIVWFGFAWLGLLLCFGDSSKGGRSGGHYVLGAAVLYTYHCLCVYVQGKYDEAEHLSRRSLAIKRHTQGADHPEVASSLNNLACILQAQVGDWNCLLLIDVYNLHETPDASYTVNKPLVGKGGS